MAESNYAMDEGGLLVPPRFDEDTNGVAGEADLDRGRTNGALGHVFAAQGQPGAGFQSVPAISRPGTPVHHATPAPPPPAGKLNWIFGLLGILTGLASFVWPLLCLTVLVSLALSAVGISRANRLRRRGANGRAVAVVGLVIGLASAANLVFGISQMLQLGSFVNRLVP